jgi:LDH2 family malate/lactate/ureidoglycolate dehydrogenase
MNNKIFNAQQLIEMGRRLLLTGGLMEEDAKTIANDLVEADLRGLHSHGVSRIPMYLKRIEKKVVNPRPNIQVEKTSLASLRINGDDGMGFLVAHRAIDEGIRLAEETGVALVGCTHSTHFGMSALYVKQAIQKNYACLVFTNSSPALPVWGGRTAVLGAAPLAAGMPGGNSSPGYCLDMAMTIVARGKIRVAATNGETIPEGLALDKNGVPTTNAAEAFAGVCLPFGGAKGAAIAMLMDMLSGMYTGSKFAGDVNSLYFDYSDPQNLGHFIVLMKPDLFIPMAEYNSRMDLYYARLKSLPKPQGFEEILMPGEPEERIAAERRKNGIMITGKILEDLYQVAKANGIEMPEIFG